MGNMHSQNVVTPVNYHCPVCMERGNEPNLAGKFFIINETECQCNGCQTVFPKNQFYKTVVTDAKTC